VVEYSRAFQARAAEELGMLPDGSVIAEMMSDYAVMRDQARACAGHNRATGESVAYQPRNV
jgi:hypothetical protein